MLKKICFICLFFIFSTQTSFAQRVENPLFAYTHLLPSPFTLAAGKVILGSVSAIGLTDFLQLETNLILDFYQIFNARARVSLLDFPTFALGAYVGYQYVNLRSLNKSNPGINLNSWLPGASMGVAILPELALFLGGNFDFSSPANVASSVTTAGFLQGAQMESDLSWAYNTHKKAIGNVISAGVSYNITYDIYGFGLSHHWRGFQLGAHYYPNASTLKLYPIIAGGATFEL